MTTQFHKEKSYLKTQLAFAIGVVDPDDKDLTPDQITRSIKRTLSGCYVAGGAVRSVFTQDEINDFDIYVKDHATMMNVCQALSEAIGETCVQTDKSVTFVVKPTHAASRQNVQVIVLDVFDSAEKIFDSFDFTCCMGAYDVDADEFVLHDDFLSHNSQRVLNFNPKTRYPYNSMVRVTKYAKRGYKINASTQIKMSIACSMCNITTWKEFFAQLGGLYGMIVSKKERPAEEFSFERALDFIERMPQHMFMNKHGDVFEQYDDNALYESAGFDQPIKYAVMGEYILYEDYDGELCFKHPDSLGHVCLERWQETDIDEILDVNNSWYLLDLPKVRRFEGDTEYNIAVTRRVLHDINTTIMCDTSYSNSRREAFKYTKVSKCSGRLVGWQIGLKPSSRLHYYGAPISGPFALLDDVSNVQEVAEMEKLYEYAPYKKYIDSHPSKVEIYTDTYTRRYSDVFERKN